MSSFSNLVYISKIEREKGKERKEERRKEPAEVFLQRC